MADFATPMDMERRSGGAIEADHPYLADELAAASQAIRKYCGWHIAGVEEKTLRKVRPFCDEVWIPAMEIKSIDSATIDGVVVDVAGVEFDPDTGWTPLRGRSVSVTYTAGFATPPMDLKTLTLELAAGALGSPLGISREQAGGVSVTFTRASGSLLVGEGGEDAARLAPYKLGVLP